MDVTKWAYVKIELEILGKVVDARYVLGKDYERIYQYLKTVGKFQPYEWAIFIKRHIGKKSLYQRKLRNRKEKERRRKVKEKKLKETLDERDK